MMRINVALASDQENDDVDNIINLKKRIQENVDSVSVKQEQKPLNPDDAAGGILSSILDVFAGKEFLENIVDTIKEWIKARPAIVESKKSKLEIVVENGEKKTTIKVENIKDLEKLKILTDSITQ